MSAQIARTRSRVEVVFMRLLVLAAVVLIVSETAVGTFVVHSEAMWPTLHAGDRILISKLEYGLKVPMLDGDGAAEWSLPKRGDLIVFGSARASGAYLVRRVIGLPGELVNMQESQILVDGESLPRRLLRKNVSCFDHPVRFLGGVPGFDLPVHFYLKERCSLWSEKAGTRAHKILEQMVRGKGHRQFRVPHDAVLALGDNRDNAAGDNPVSTVPLEDIRGKAVLILWSREQLWPHKARMGRVLSWIE